MIFNLIIVFVIYFAIILMGVFYVNLFFTQEEFTRSDFTNVTPFLKSVWENIHTRFSVVTTLLVIICSGILGMILPLLSYHWIINSSLIFVLVYFLAPFARGRYEKVQVSDSDDYSDAFKNIFILYNNLIIVFFGTGYGTGLMYHWATTKDLNFLWFAVNITAVTIFAGKAFRKSELFE